MKLPQNNETKKSYNNMKDPASLDWIKDRDVTYQNNTFISQQEWIMNS